MKFKNPFEKECYDIACKVLKNKNDISIEHNKVIKADFDAGEGIISFTGTPKKEIDVFVLRIRENTKLLLSVKEHEEHKSPPADIQEWGNVVNTFQKYSINDRFLGMIICSTGFTSGCGSWAMSNNLGLIPPYKGKPIVISKDIILKMLERSIIVTQKILDRNTQNLFDGKNYYWCIFKCVSDLME